MNTTTQTALDKALAQIKLERGTIKSLCKGRDDAVAQLREMEKRALRAELLEADRWIGSLCDAQDPPEIEAKRARLAELEKEPFHKCAKCDGETTRGRAYCGDCSPFKAGKES